MINAPCKNCADRSVGCHGACKDYIEYVAEHKNEVKMNRITKPCSISKNDFSGTSPRPGKHRKTRERGFIR